MMMVAKRRSIFLITFLTSCILHTAVFSFFSFQIEAKKTPVIYAWQGLLTKKDLSFGEKNVSFWWDVASPLGEVRRDYFTSVLPYREYAYPSGEIVYPSSFIAPSFKEGHEHLYLWKKGMPFSSSRKETVSYRVFVSPSGKIILSFPHRLPFNSEGGIFLQEYLREASIFLNEKFFWTKCEGVVQ